MDSQIDPDTSTMAKKLQSYYQDKKFDSKTVVDAYNKFIQDTYPDEPDMKLKPGLSYGATSIDQRVGLGLYMAAKGELKLS
jgi:hypothetical protein